MDYVADQEKSYYWFKDVIESKKGRKGGKKKTMKKIVLVCNGGMSTAMLAKRMREASEEELDIAAYGEVEVFQSTLKGASVYSGWSPAAFRFRIPDFKKETDIPIVGNQSPALWSDGW